jgi:hypothetical protein
VAELAESLPVRLIPKESLIAFVGDDVVDNDCRGYLSCLLALGTKRMFQEKALPRSTPPGVIALTRGRSAHLIDLFAFLSSMSFAAPMTRVHKDRAAWKPARMRWRERAHTPFLFAWRSTIRFIDAFLWCPRGSLSSSIT